MSTLFPRQLAKGGDSSEAFGASRVFSRAGHALELANKRPNALFMKLVNPNLKDEDIQLVDTYGSSMARRKSSRPHSSLGMEHPQNGEVQKQKARPLSAMGGVMSSEPKPHRTHQKAKKLQRLTELMATNVETPPVGHYNPRYDAVMRRVTTINFSKSPRFTGGRSSLSPKPSQHVPRRAGSEISPAMAFLKPNPSPKPQGDHRKKLKINLLGIHVPCINLGRLTGRPATARSSVPDAEPDYPTNLFPESCTRFSRIQNTVNIKKQEPRKEVVKVGITLEYYPKYDAVLPQPRITRIMNGTTNKKTPGLCPQRLGVLANLLL